MYFNSAWTLILIQNTMMSSTVFCLLYVAQVARISKNSKAYFLCA